jgi:hypothetical protein
LPPKEETLNDRYDGQQGSEENLLSGVEVRDLIKRRFSISLSAVFFGLLCSFCGGYAFYNKRFILSAALILLGLAGLGGLLLFWLVRSPSTWGWIV